MGNYLIKERLQETQAYPDHLDAEINLIRRDDVKQLVKMALGRVPEEFWTAAASSSGKYHPAFAAGTGGLVRHTRAAVWFAKQILELENAPYAYMTDYIYAALILHDTAKHGILWGETTVHDHPLLVREYISQDELPVEMWQRWLGINHLISTHMGQWRTSKYSDVELPQITEGAQFFVHTCDLLASKKSVSLDFLVPIEDTEGDIERSNA